MRLLSSSELLDEADEIQMCADLDRAAIICHAGDHLEGSNFMRWPPGKPGV